MSLRHRNLLPIEIIAAVQESVRNNPNHAISCRLQKLSIWFSTWRILHKVLDLHPYNIQLTKTNHHLIRHRFTDWTLMLLKIDVDFCGKIIFSDEAPFWVNSFVNKQNYRIWEITIQERFKNLNKSRFGVDSRLAA